MMRARIISIRTLGRWPMRYTEYSIEVVYKEQRHTVSHRFSDFLRLYEYLCNRFVNKDSLAMSYFPPKVLFNTISPEVVHKRIRQLNVCLKMWCADSQMIADAPFLFFLGVVIQERVQAPVTSRLIFASSREIRHGGTMHNSVQKLPPFPANSRVLLTKSPNPDYEPIIDAHGRTQRRHPEFILPEMIDIDPLSFDGNYSLLTSAVTPRPISLCCTINKHGQVNCAPFSYFNIISEGPPVIMMSFVHPNNKKRDSLRNIEETGEMTVNIVSEWMCEEMNQCAGNYVYGVDEMNVAGLTKVASVRVSPPRVGNSAIQFECKLRSLHHIRKNEMNPESNDNSITHTVVLAHIVLYHVRRELYDEKTQSIDCTKLRPIARMGGALYASVSVFPMSRPGGQLLLPQLSVDWNTIIESNTKIAIEMQEPFSQYVLEGKKTIETRTYAFPNALIGKEILIIESPSSNVRGSTLLDRCDTRTNDNIRIIGSMVIKSCVQYQLNNEWSQDYDKHCVHHDSIFHWSTSSGTPMYAWRIESVKPIEQYEEHSTFTRLFRSFFRVEPLAADRKTLINELLSPKWPSTKQLSNHHRDLSTTALTTPTNNKLLLAQQRLVDEIEHSVQVLQHVLDPERRGSLDLAKLLDGGDTDSNGNGAHNIDDEDTLRSPRSNTFVLEELRETLSRLAERTTTELVAKQIGEEMQFDWK